MAIFSGKRYFNDILWAQAYNNNIEKKLSYWNKCSVFRSDIETV
jgi:hypothetical protein